jgi:hypothetical protein
MSNAKFNNSENLSELKKGDLFRETTEYKQGLQGEKHVESLIKDSNSFEVKTDMAAKETGNICVEIWQYHKGKWQMSGLSITEAETFVVNLLDDEDNIIISVAMNTEWLKKRVKKLYKDGYARIIEKPMDEKGPTNQSVLIPFSQLYITDKELAEKQNKKQETKRQLLQDAAQKLDGVK